MFELQPPAAMRRTTPFACLCMASSAFAMRAPHMRPQLPQQLGGAAAARSLPSPLFPVAQHARHASRSTHMMAPWDAPTDWFVYGHLHLILALPTLTLLSLSPPLQRANPLQKQMSYAFIVFIVCIGVAQSFIWDSYGASMGFWEFNPDKCTSRDDLAIPIEEVLWLFHHVLKTALYQLKAFELVGVQADRGVPSPQLRASVSALLVAACAFGVWALLLSPDDTVKCIGLVCAFFAPVWLVIWQIGSQFVLRHANRITIGWFLPGVTTVLIDCLGQQQGVWRFPEQYLSGISQGYLKLDIVLVYMMSTFAVTGTGAIIIAATEELINRRAALGMPPPGPLDVARYIFGSMIGRDLQVADEGAAFGYDSTLAVGLPPVLPQES